MPLQNIIFLGIFFAFLIYLIIDMIKKRKGKTVEIPYSQVRVKKVNSYFKEGFISSAECDGGKKIVKLKILIKEVRKR